MGEKSFVLALIRWGTAGGSWGFWSAERVKGYGFEVERGGFGLWLRGY